MVKRLRRSAAWVVVATAFAICFCLATGDASSLRTPIASRRLADDYIYDGETTYCWGAKANVSSSDVSSDLIFVRGVRTDCPLALHVETTNPQSLSVGQRLTVTWTVTPAATAETALFSLKDATALVDKRTRQRATIIHSNVHTCHVGTGCDAFRQGQTDTNASTNQVGNLSALPVTFTTSDVVFATAGKHVVLAHIIVPGLTFDTRYDFAVFTTVDVVGDTSVRSAGDATVQGHGSPSQPGDATTNTNTTTTKSTSHGISKSQIVVLSVVGALLIVLLLIVIVISKRNESPSLLCSRKRDNSELVTTKGTTTFCVRGSNLRTRSSDWSELYAIGDMLPLSAPADTDDANAIAILRDSSRTSTPCSTPVHQGDRMVADFRHDVARWDERASASPITPSSSAILIAAIQDSDRISSTPSTDGFVPIESLVLASPPAVCLRPPSPPRPRWKKPFRNSGRKRRQQPRVKHLPPEDSGDEQERDM